MTDDFNSKKSRAARDRGIKQVTDHNEYFSHEFAMAIGRLPNGWVGTCEDIRKTWTGIRPHHPNAWGGAWNAAKKRGQLVELREQVHMTAVKSHARKTHLYQKVNFPTEQLDMFDAGSPESPRKRDFT